MLRPIRSCLQFFHSLVPCVVFAIVFVEGTAACAQDDEFSPGLIARYAHDENVEEAAVRTDPVIAFHWGSRPPDRRLSQGDFSAHWQGYLMSQARGTYRLRAFAAGRVTIELNGEVLLDETSAEPCWLDAQPIDLSFDWHPLEVTFERTSDDPRIALYWEGPGFQLEPITSRWFFHDPDETPPDDFARGATLVRALRCAACHELPGELAPSPAPALDQLSGNIAAEWLVDWLSKAQAEASTGCESVTRRMPHFSLQDDEAADITAYLLRDQKQPGDKPRKIDAKARDAGEQLFLTLGCLACHRVGELGQSGLFGGGNLSRIAAKRSRDFFARWLADPSKSNRHHRMPVFELSKEEREQLSAYLSTLGEHATGGPASRPEDSIQRGRKLVEQKGCSTCHLVSEVHQPRELTRSKIPPNFDASQACVGDPDAATNRPGYCLTQDDTEAVRDYLSAIADVKKRALPAESGRWLLAEHNCLACHARDGSVGLAEQLPAVAQAHSKLGALLPAMTPPPLTSVGDKLHDAALKDAVARKSPVHRPWLLVRMPRFNLSDEQLDLIVRQFVDVDRIPPFEIETADAPSDSALTIAGPRLVTTDGFGCTSCHQVGDVLPPDAPLNARGADLSQLGRRIRHEWFDRWVRNPVRIVPNMEMPSVQLAVGGVLDENLDHQLAAVWHVLNQPGFEPPRPNAVRIVRRSGIQERNERAIVLTDVLYRDEQIFVKPFLIGFPNRHSALFDLESGRITGWWIGDVARQRTEGKTWFWESAGTDLLKQTADEAELTLVHGDDAFVPIRTGQFITEADRWWHMDGQREQHPMGGVQFDYRLLFQGQDNARVVSKVREHVAPIWSDESSRESGWRRDVTIAEALANSRFRLRLLGKEAMANARVGDFGRELTLGDGTRIRVVFPHDARFEKDGSLLSSTMGRWDTAQFKLEYLTMLPVDQFPVVPPAFDPPAALTLDVVPGFEATQLPLAEDLMPTALAWEPEGTIVVTSLKGRVWLGRDTDDDGLEDELQPFGDELAAPFGVFVQPHKNIDVINKYALLRLRDINDDGQYDETVTLASGWGHTTDYHDWATGLPRDEDGNYYIALSCQQDERSEPAAYLRGKVVKLARRTDQTGRASAGTPDDPRIFTLEPLSSGHRFPIGIARSRDGELFVSDNQGNFNPFNELNHVMRDSHYGFINANERKKDFQPNLTAPAIDIPHPWTRSVNGICFLETPAAVKESSGRDVFGPFAGHLVGCEYDTRRLIRMSLQKVGDTYQGAAYPFSFDKPPSGPPLLGPLCCAVAPDGDLYIGSIRDSGWGGANNIGTLVRIRPKGADLPTGIAEVRATATGFTIDFTNPVDPTRAADRSNYSLLSYTRVSTPAYGGPDVNRRAEPIAGIDVSRDGQSAALKFDELRAGYVYEFNIKNLNADQQTLFFPAEAHYTLRVIPE